MFIKILIWSLNKVFNGKKRHQIEPCIKELYRRTVRDEFKITSEIVKVKKGNRRYDLIFFETKKGKVKFNLGRHWEDNTIFENTIE